MTTYTFVDMPPERALEYMKLVLVATCNPGKMGHFAGPLGSPVDPIFFPIHNGGDRIVAAKRFEPGFHDKWDNGCFGQMVYEKKRATCWGHKWGLESCRSAVPRPSPDRPHDAASSGSSSTRATSTCPTCTTRSTSRRAST